MNELYIPLGRLYFKTKETSAEKALGKLTQLCEDAGIELYAEASNGNPSAYLRNEDGEDIDECGRE